MRRRNPHGLACPLALGVVLALAALAVHAAAPTAPAPGLGPREVVAAQLHALRNNGDGDTGIAIAYAFASPQNQAAVGGLAAFTAMIYHGFGDMLVHESAILSAPEYQGGEAAVHATLILPNGARTAYVFVLRKVDTPECAGCWRSIGVIPTAPPPGAQYRV